MALNPDNYTREDLREDTALINSLKALPGLPAHFTRVAGKLPAALASTYEQLAYKDRQLLELTVARDIIAPAIESVLGCNGAVTRILNSAITNRTARLRSAEE